MFNSLLSVASRKRSVSLGLRSSSFFGVFAMTDQPFQDWKTTRALPASATHVHALGAITLLYNDLEYTMSLLLDQYLGAGQEIAEPIFVRLTNNQRIDIITGLANKLEKDEAALKAVLYALKCFGICGENRNILMHLIHDWSEGAKSDLFARKRSSDKSHDVFYLLSEQQLRKVADEMLATRQYIRGLDTYLYRQLLNRTGGRPTNYLKLTGPDSLPKKPPQPDKLIPHQPGPDQKNG